MIEGLHRNFTCPLTEESCDDGRCRRTQCAFASNEEAQVRQLDIKRTAYAEQQRLEDESIKREAALRVAIDGVAALNRSQNEKTYRLPDPKGKRGPKRKAEEEALNRLIDTILTAPRFADRLALAIDAVRAGRRLPHQDATDNHG